MKIKLVWEHKLSDTMLYCENLPGAFARGKSLEEAMAKLSAEVDSYCRWRGWDLPESLETELSQEIASELNIADADSDAIFDSELEELSPEEYSLLKTLALRSAGDFQRLYDSIPDKDNSILPARSTFYGAVPRTAREMYEHTRSVNSYYFAEIGVEAGNEGSIYECRLRGFEELERQPGFLKRGAEEGSYGEWWSLRKVLRRFIWHDRIHARAMCRMAKKTFGKYENPFKFEV